MTYKPNPLRPFPKTYSPKKVKKPLPKRGITGELDFFKALWAIRKHVSHFSGEAIPEFKPVHFMHILPKSRYPYFRLHPKNIVLGTEDEHHIHHNIARSLWPEDFRKEMERLETELKEEYRQKYQTKK